MTTLTAQVIIIGDELLNGAIYDANLAPIATWLLERGIKLTKASTVRDAHQELTQAINSAWDSSDLVITSGGLGPTKDDITKSVLGEIVSGELRESEKAIELVSAQYKKMSKEWIRETNLYHMIPLGIDVFKNPKGLAPGLMIKKDNKLLLATPGVPRELTAMIEEEFDQVLNSVFSHLPKPDQKISIRTRGIPEEKIFFGLMPDLWSELESFGKVSSLPQLLGVDIHLQFSAQRNKLELEEQLRVKLENSPLAPHIWHWGQESIESEIIKRASEKNLTIGLGESCTGGLLAHRLTNISGSSKVFLGSLVTYANQAKQDILGVKKNSLKDKGAVSEEVALEMARGVGKVLNTDISIALTGIAGPTGGSDKKPVGTLCIGHSTVKGDDATRVNYNGSREQLKERFAQAALFKLLEIIDTF